MKTWIALRHFDSLSATQLSDSVAYLKPKCLKIR